MDLKSIQKPLKEQYRNDPNASRITLKAKGGQTETPIACSVAVGRAIYQAQAHSGVGGAGTAACSGDLLLGALSACAQLTCQMVAAAMGVPTEHIEVTVEETWICAARWASQRTCRWGLKVFGCDSTSMRQGRRRNNCRRCVRRPNNIV